MVPHGHAGPVRCGHGQATLNGALCGDAGGQSLLWPSLASCATAVLGECGRAAIFLLEILGMCCHCVCRVPGPMHRCCSRRPVAQRDAAAGHPGAAHSRLLPAMWPLAVRPCLCKPTPGNAGVVSSTCWAASSCADKTEPAAGREAQGARQGCQDPPEPARGPCGRAARRRGAACSAGRRNPAGCRAFGRVRGCPRPVRRLQPRAEPATSRGAAAAGRRRRRARRAAPGPGRRRRRARRAVPGPGRGRAQVQRAARGAGPRACEQGCGRPAPEAAALVQRRARLDTPAGGGAGAGPAAAARPPAPAQL